MDEQDAARDIATRLLDETGSAMDSGDFDAFLDCFVLPQEMETPTGRRVLETPEEMRATFDAVRQMYDRERVRHVVRHCIEASFRDENTIVSTHESRLVTDDLVLKYGPYPAFSVLKFNGDRWQISFTRYEVHRAPNLMAILTEGHKDH